MSEARKGIAAIVAACIIWGLSPLYYRMLDHIPPMDVLSYRTLWSLALFGTILIIQRRFDQVFTALFTLKSLFLIVCAAALISVNWFAYILAIQIGKTMEASLGYYLFPLVAVLLGIVFFGERLSRWKWVSVSLAAIAVTILTIGLGVAPWISLVLAVSFGLYSAVKKLSTSGPVVSVTSEVLILAPLALIWLWGTYYGTWNGQGNGTQNIAWRDFWLLVLSGPITAVPLVLFSYAARRLTLTTIGIVQYISPTLQFICATVIFGEVFTVWHSAAFGLIWVALAVYSLDSVIQERAVRKATASPSKSAAKVI